MLRNAQEFKESLRDGRKIFYRGKLVEDITVHPALKVAINHASDLFRWQNDPEFEDLLVHNLQNTGIH